MTISTTIIKNSYDGDGSQLVFQYNFKVLNEADIEVILRSADGTETVKTISTDYTVSGVGEATGGNVTFVSTAPTSTEKVILRRATEQTQSLDLVENDPFTADSVEGAFDRAIAIAQELQEAVDRSIKISRTNTMNSTEFTVDANSRANKVLAFDSAGELSIAQTLGDYKGNWTSGTEFGERDIVKDASNDNIYLCVTAHTSTGSTPLSGNPDIGKWALIVDAAAATLASQTATTKAAEAVVSAAAADTSAATASTHATNAFNSATTSSTQAGVATAAATTATNKAAEADADASAAAQSATDAAASAASAAASSGGGVVKVTTNDTNANVLNEQLLGGLGINLRVENSGGDEKLRIASDAIIYAIALG